MSELIDALNISGPDPYGEAPPVTSDGVAAFIGWIGRREAARG